MKANLFLLTILLALIGLGYYSIEREEDLRRARAERESALYDASALGLLQGIATPKAKILKGGDYYYTAGDYRLADQQVVDKVFDILSNIRARRHLSAEELKNVDRKQLFPDESQLFTFYFEKGNLTYLLGRKLEFDRSFYMEITNLENKKSQVVIAYDQSADEGAYPEELYHRTPEKFNRLQQLLQLPESFFHDLHVLRRTTVPKLMESWQSIQVQSHRNPTFIIDLEKQVTAPAPYFGLRYQSSFFSDYLNRLVELKAQKIVGNKKTVKLGAPDFTLIIQKKIGGQERLSLYSQNDSSGQTQYFIVTTLSDDVLQLAPEVAQSIRIHHQDFWDLRLFSEERLSEMPPVSDFRFKVGTLATTLQLKTHRGFEVRSASDFAYNPVQEAFKKLFDLFQRPADYALLLNFDKDDQSLLSQAICQMEWMGEEVVLAAYGTDGDMVMILPKNNLGLVFKKALEDFPQVSVSYFTLKQ